MARLPSQAPPVSEAPASQPGLSPRHRLLKAAAVVFERKGYSAASVREIVETAGVTKPVLYYHFGSKQGLLVAILESAARALATVIDQASAFPGSARSRLTNLCTGVWQLARTRASELRVSHTVYFTASELVPSFDFEVFDRTLIDGIERLIREGVAAREFRPVSVPDAALAVLGVVVLCIDSEILRPDNRLDEAGLIRVLDHVFDGLCPHA